MSDTRDQVEEPLENEEDLADAVPQENHEPDNDPDDTAEYQAVEAQDREGTVRPAVDKHPED